MDVHAKFFYVKFILKNMMFQQLNAGEFLHFVFILLIFFRIYGEGVTISYGIVFCLKHTISYIENIFLLLASK